MHVDTLELTPLDVPIGMHFGDGRTYDHVCALRVTSTDGMTADFYAFEPAFLG